jgi:hypothetical protein
MSDDCCYTCVGCGLTTCRGGAPSPGEVDGVCASCFAADLEDDRLRARDYEAWANL